MWCKFEHVSDESSESTYCGGRGFGDDQDIWIDSHWLEGNQQERRPCLAPKPGLEFP